MNRSGMYCNQCGELNDAGAQFCRKCGAAQAGARPAASISSSALGTAASSAPARLPAAEGQIPPPQGPIPYGPPATVAPPPPGVASTFRGYGGFWLRVVATLIDGALLSVVIFPLWLLLFGAIGAMGSFPGGGSARRAPDAAVGAVLLLLPVVFLAVIAINWLYEALMTSSSRQATLGKMALGLKVIDKNGNRLSFWHATGRHFAKMINGFILYIGFIMVGFTERKQGLHDMIAGTYVIKA